MTLYTTAFCKVRQSNQNSPIKARTKKPNLALQQIMYYLFYVEIRDLIIVNYMTKIGERIHYIKH